MPTVGERLATLAERVDGIDDKMDAVLHLLNGGGDIAWERSVRGRLHELRTDVDALILLRGAVKRLVSRGWRLFAGAIAFVFAAAPYVLYFLTR